MTKPRITSADVRCSRKARRGFTLVELTITMLIMGILAAVAAPQFAGALDHYRAEAAAARIAADLNYVRRVAMNTSSNRCVEFTISDNGNHDYRSTGSKGVPSLRKPSKALNVHFKVLMPGVDLVSASFDSYMAVEFNHYGLPLAGDEKSGIPLTAMTSGQVVISSGREQRTIVIAPATGKATVQ